jgi:hypothetical protein
MTEAAPVETASDSLITEQPAGLDFSLGKPEGFPDDFWDAEKKAPSVDKLYNSYAMEKKRAEGLRVKLSKGEFEGKAPEDIKEYAVELSEELKPLVPDGDPMFEAARLAAKEAGMSKDQFSKFMPVVLTKLSELSAAANAPKSPEEQAAERSLEISKLGPNGSRVVEAVGSFIDQLRAGGTFNDAEAKTAKDMAFNADAVKVLNKFRMMAGGGDQVPVEVPVDVAASRQDISTKMAQAMMAGNEAEYNKYASMLAKHN